MARQSEHHSEAEFPLARLDPAVCSSLEELLSREWLETNGLGGFAGASVAGPSTRRYHGLLLAALNPPAERRLLWAGVDEFLHLGDRNEALSAHAYPGAMHPQGYRHLTGFRLDPWPIWTYDLGSVQVEREFFLVHGEDTAVLRYRLLGAAEAQLELRPFLAFRDFHALTHQNSAADPSCAREDGRCSFRLYDGYPALHFHASAGEFEAWPDWYRNFEYRLEQERGLDFQEDLLSPGLFRLTLRAGMSAGVVATLGGRRFEEAEELARSERARRSRLVRALPEHPALPRRLALAADAFLVRTAGGGQTVMAGYPWFGAWGRDTMISLPGLCLAAGRAAEARAILQTWSRHASGGMLPNRLPDGPEEPEFNSIDATLWFFLACHRYLQATGDLDLIRELLPVLEEAVARYTEGTRFGIQADSDGLLSGGQPGVQLTWMDAKVGDWVVTPRSGKAVEVCALWYNALRILEEFERKTGRALEAMAYTRRAERTRKAFAPAFWNARRGCLYDVLTPEGPDEALRPNQIFALSLPFRLLDPDQERSVLRVVREHLLTPYGLRSLAPGEPGYVGRYQGGLAERDGAYHQGTVWSWLIGPYLDALRTVEGDTPSLRAERRRLLDPLLCHLDQAGLNSVSEIFDGDPPHAPRGCFAQAWSVAELLRSM